MESLNEESAGTADGAEEAEAVKADEYEVICFETALKYGVNCIVLPVGNETAAESLGLVAEKNNLQILEQQAEGYAIFTLQSTAE